ncbi:Topology modulation protein [Corynebacterium pseudotuberculosis]|nr:Topology modulation protein [Corynebacterium pseudotuberculosis]
MGYSQKMKIAIMGYSGGGKSTLARRLGSQLNAPVLHLDSIHFSAGWVERNLAEESATVEAFLNTHSDWIIDGNYALLSEERRLAEADRIILILVPRAIRLWRVFLRLARYYGTTRPDMARGCPEKIDCVFLKWVLWDSCTKEKRKHYAEIAEKYPGKTEIRRR